MSSSRADSVPPLLPARLPNGGPTPPPPQVDEPDAPKWTYMPFSSVDFVITGTAAAAAFIAASVSPQPKHAIGGVLFDNRVRDAVRLGDATERYMARDASDVGLSLLVTWPIFVDSLITAWWYRGSREVAQEIALIDLQTLAIAGAVQGFTNVIVSRERPYGSGCGTTVPAATIDCDGTTKHRSFFSGHAAFSFTSAALICSHHMKHDLLGGPWDATSCIAGYAVAATTASLRVVSDMHYSTDILTGAIVGTVIGYGVPFLHYRRKQTQATEPNGVQLNLVPSAGGASLTGVF